MADQRGVPARLAAVDGRAARRLGVATATTYRIGGAFGVYKRASIPGYFAFAALLAVLGLAPSLVAILFVGAAANAVAALFLLSIRTVVDDQGIQLLAFRRRELTRWESIERGVLVETADRGGKKTKVPGIRLRDASEVALRDHVGRGHDGRRETLVERVRLELDARAIPREWS